jgi:hypothetical protein
MNRTDRGNERGVGVELRFAYTTLGGDPPTTETCSDDSRLRPSFCRD